MKLAAFLNYLSTTQNDTNFKILIRVHVLSLYHAAATRSKSLLLRLVIPGFNLLVIKSIYFPNLSCGSQVQAQPSFILYHSQHDLSPASFSRALRRRRRSSRSSTVSFSRRFFFLRSLSSGMMQATALNITHSGKI